ncbi:cytochrome P450 [Halovivax sp.]|uniref:cytochrome P450 n=1 Tax=Halovivax sp. TaxID=1935978 RepID=UPI0025C68DBF|nr:cytochrome P450 [Halovivax sp.]
MTTDEGTVPPQPEERLLATGDEQLRDLIYGSMSGEFASSVDGKPATFPLTPFYDEDRGVIVVTSPVAFAKKADAVRKNPRVSLLLHDETGEYLVTGDATVDDDLESNAPYVRELTDREPDTPKRIANEEKYDFVETRAGRVLAGWLGERIVIEVEPRAMTRVADPQGPLDLPAWPAVEMGQPEADRFERGVITVVGDDGYPKIHPVTSIRLDDDAAVVETTTPTPITDGQPACLLLHWHDEASIKLGQRLVRGRSRTMGDAFVLDPGSSSTLRNEGIVDTTRFLLDGKRKTRAYLASRTPPGPRGIPLAGNTVQFLRDPFQFYANLPSYGDVVRYSIGGNTWTAVLHPDDVERVLVSDSHRFARYNFEELGFDFINEGLFFSEGEQWRRQRKTIQPTFAPRNLAVFSETVVDETLEAIDGWDDGEVLVANEVFSNLTLEVLTTTLFDVDLDERRLVVTDAAHSLSNRVDTQSVSAILPGWVPTRRNRDFNRKMAAFDEMVAELIEERRRDDSPRNDLLSTLLELTDDDTDEPDEDGYRFSDEALRDQLVTFLFAGHETTALVLTWAFQLLSRHEDVLTTLEEELETVCGDRAPTVEDVPSLEYTEKVIQETMRYYPPIYVLFRKALEDVTIDGYLIPRGTKLTIPQFLLHADERWWDDPRTFRPERWTDELDDELPEYAYFPFGGGPRHCVGMRFAKMFLSLGIATIAQRVRFDLESEPDPALHMAATLSPADDVELRVRRR